MSTSCDACIFFGYHFPEEYELPDAVEETYLSDAEVQYGYHGAYDYTTPFICYGPSLVRNWRGATAIDLDVIARVQTTAGVESKIRAFAGLHGIPGPDTEYGDEGEYRTSQLGWWLVSLLG